MHYKEIIVNYQEDLATITLNRPDKLNALSPTMRKELLEALEDLEHKKEVRILIITGTGRAFCAGGDIEYLYELRKSKDIASFKKLLAFVKQLVLTIHKMPIPVIAGINGAAAGAGLNLAMACDIRIASENASFGATFTKLGIHPDWGNTFLLPRIVGTAKACEMLFTGNMIPASEALQWGLINKIVPQTELYDASKALANTIILNSPLAVSLAKHALYEGVHRNLSEMFEMEEEAQLQCFQSQDALEGISAFLEKRKPGFTGK